MAGDGLARGEKKARRYGCPIRFEDETGFLPAPARLTCLAPAGATPVLGHRAKFRRKVGAAAVVCLSPIAGHARLQFQTCRDAYVTNQPYADFLRDVFRSLGGGPVVYVADNAPSHRGECTDELGDEFPWLADFACPLPPYAPT